MSCSDYALAIWDSNGEYVFDSFIDGLQVNICYDPTQCYLFEMETYTDECDYKLMMGGKVSKTGKATYDVFRVGNCEDPCPGQRELVIATYIDGYGNTDFRWYRSGQGDEEATIIEGNAKSYCIDIGACNIMARAKTGWTFFMYLENNQFINSGGFEYTKTFGNCTKLGPWGSQPLQSGAMLA